jgi:hypothetical protein
MKAREPLHHKRPAISTKKRSSMHSHVLDSILVALQLQITRQGGMIDLPTTKSQGLRDGTQHTIETSCLLTSTALG